MSRLTEVYLVPGFFGFTQLGSLNYFQRVADVLGEALEERGIAARIIEVETQPTSSIRRRALRLKETVEAEGGLETDEIHFIGHSTGGLDIRLLLTPGVQLEESAKEQEIAQRTRSAITLATPHFGTPLANVFTSLNGRNLLFALTMLATSSPGRMSIYAAARFITHLARWDDYLGQRGTFLDSLVERLLKDITPERGQGLYDFLRTVASDQGAMVQLTPESIDLFNASVPDRTGVDCVSFVTAAPPPTPSLTLPDRWDVYNIVSGAIFTIAYLVTAREHRHYPYPSLAYEVESQIREGLPFELGPGTNDGIVPTLSQVWGRLGGVVVCDHLDAVGQFHHEEDGQRYAGWLHSGAAFEEVHFRKLWSDIADVVAGNSRAQKTSSVGSV